MNFRIIIPEPPAKTISLLGQSISNIVNEGHVGDLLSFDGTFWTFGKGSTGSTGFVVEPGCGM